MKITGFNKQTLIDYPGKISAEIFTAGCNYGCYSCHAKHILQGNSVASEDEVIDYLKRAKGFIDGLVICGGEPTLQKDLPDFAERVKKETGLAIKLDTNGSKPDVLEYLLRNALVDYVAMDVKGPRNLYPIITGRNDVVVSDVEKSMAIVQKFPEYEFRTTVVPVFDEEKLRWFNFLEAENMARWIIETTNNNKHKYFLQRFIARKKEEGAMLDDRFAKENLPKEFQETPKEVLINLRDAARQYLLNCEIRE